MTRVARNYELDIRRTCECIPEHNQAVWYWFDSFERWYPGKFIENGDASAFVSSSGSGFLDYRDVSFWMPLECFYLTLDPNTIVDRHLAYEMIDEINE